MLKLLKPPSALCVIQCVLAVKRNMLDLYGHSGCHFISTDFFWLKIKDMKIEKIVSIIFFGGWKAVWMPIPVRALLLSE